MSIKQKTEFQQWIEQIPHVDYARIRSSIIEECNVSRATFASWARGETSPDLDKRVTITVIAYRYDGDTLPFKNMFIEFDEEGEIQVRMKQ